MNRCFSRFLRAGCFARLSRLTHLRAAGVLAVLAMWGGCAFAPAALAQVGMPTPLEFQDAAAAPRLPGVRPFSAKARRAVMQITQPPELLLNARAERFSPGARIFGANGLLVLSATLVGQSLPVVFEREAQGLVHTVWVLNPTEAALSERQLIPAAAPTANP